MKRASKTPRNPNVGEGGANKKQKTRIPERATKGVRRPEQESEKKGGM